MRILLTGASGQDGWELARLLPSLGDVIALDRSQCDLSDLNRLRDIVSETKPDVVVNAAAFTAVDQAEREPQAARIVNAAAPEVLAKALKRTSGLLVHYSTDYVFDGTKAGPYHEEDPTNPINAYGVSKLEGEQAIRSTGVAHLTFRTSWVYGTRGRNFLLTMLRLFEQRPEIEIVSDQIGTPTWCRWIAEQTVAVLDLYLSGDRRCSGTFHMTADGFTSWYGFATAIRELHCSRSGEPVPRLLPIKTGEYPTIAKRPLNSVLSNSKLIALGLVQPSWEALLMQCLAALSSEAAT